MISMLLFDKDLKGKTFLFGEFQMRYSTLCGKYVKYVKKYRFVASGSYKSDQQIY